MNTKLVESLAQVIESLAPDEYSLLQEKLKSRTIQKTIGVCGGHARIRNTRIPVWTIISLQQQGADTPELLRNFPSLTIDDLSNARFYYNTHQEEIDLAIPLTNTSKRKRALARFYSNENFAIDIVQILRDYGHDVLTSYEARQANQGIPDPEVLKFATNQNRILITFNRDDFIDLHRSGMNHSGIIICKDDRDYLGQAKFINDFLQSQITELSDRLIRIQKQNKPKSSTPAFIIREY